MNLYTWTTLILVFLFNYLYLSLCAFFMIWFDLLFFEQDFQASFEKVAIAMDEL